MPTFRKKPCTCGAIFQKMVSGLMVSGCCAYNKRFSTQTFIKSVVFNAGYKDLFLLLRLKTNPFLSGQGKINANGIWCFCVHVFHFLRMIGLHRGKMTPLLVPPLSFSLLPSWSWHMVSIRGSLLQGAAVGGSLWGALWGHYGNLWGRRAAAG